MVRRMLSSAGHGGGRGMRVGSISSFSAQPGVPRRETAEGGVVRPCCRTARRAWRTSSAAGSVFPDGDRKKFGIVDEASRSRDPRADVQQDPPVPVLVREPSGCRPSLQLGEVRVVRRPARRGTRVRAARRTSRIRERACTRRDACPRREYRTGFRIDQPWAAIVVIASTTWAVSTVGDGKISVKLGPGGSGRTPGAIRPGRSGGSATVATASPFPAAMSRARSSRFRYANSFRRSLLAIFFG